MGKEKRGQLLETQKEEWTGVGDQIQGLREREASRMASLRGPRVISTESARGVRCKPEGNRF